MKRLAARASLQRPYDDQIMTPRQLYEWAQHDIPTVTFNYCTQEQYDEEKSLLEEIFELSRPIVGTQSLHSAIPISTNELVVRKYSTATSMMTVQVFVKKDDVIFDNIAGYVTCKYDSHWWLAYVLDTNRETEEATVSFLHPHGPAPSFVYPRNPDVLSIHITSVLTKVNPMTATGRTYRVDAEEQAAAATKLAE